MSCALQIDAPAHIPMTPDGDVNIEQLAREFSWGRAIDFYHETNYRNCTAVEHVASVLWLLS
jgi:hypothetical protein